jgi:hypothetical protein
MDVRQSEETKTNYIVPGNQKRPRQTTVCQAIRRDQDKLQCARQSEETKTNYSVSGNQKRPKTKTNYSVAGNHKRPRQTTVFIYCID